MWLFFPLHHHRNALLLRDTELERRKTLLMWERALCVRMYWWVCVCSTSCRRCVREYMEAGSEDSLLLLTISTRRRGSWNTEGSKLDRRLRLWRKIRETQKWAHYWCQCWQFFFLKSPSTDQKNNLSISSQEKHSGVLNSLSEDFLMGSQRWLFICYNTF